MWPEQTHLIRQIASLASHWAAKQQYAHKSRMCFEFNGVRFPRIRCDWDKRKCMECQWRTAHNRFKGISSQCFDRSAMATVRFPFIYIIVGMIRFMIAMKFTMTYRSSETNAIDKTISWSSGNSGALSQIRTKQRAHNQCIVVCRNGFYWLIFLLVFSLRLSSVIVTRCLARVRWLMPIKKPQKWLRWRKKIKR